MGKGGVKGGGDEERESVCVSESMIPSRNSAESKGHALLCQGPVLLRFERE